MSSGAGGEVAVVAVGAAVAIPVIAAAGLAIGVAKGTEFVVTQISDRWAEHERLVELDRAQREIKRERFKEYLRARQKYDEVPRLTTGVGGSTPELPAPTDLTPDSPVGELQVAVVEFQLAAAAARMEYESLAAKKQAAELAAALAHTAKQEARRSDADLARGASRLRVEREEARLEQDMVAEQLVAEKLAELTVQSARRAGDRTRERITTALGELPSDLDAEIGDRIGAWIDRLPELRDSQWDQAVADIDVLVGRARADAADRAHHCELAAAVLASLAGCRTGAAVEIAWRAQAFLDGDQVWDPGLPHKARVELQRVQEQLESLAAAGALEASLVDLGYDVGSDFATVVTTEAGAFVHSPGWGEEHAVQIGLDAVADRVFLEVVREANPSGASTRLEKARDVEIERQFCNDLPELVKAAQSHGLEIGIDIRIEPGEADLLRVATTGRRARTLRRAGVQERADKIAGDSDE